MGAAMGQVALLKPSVLMTVEVEHVQEPFFSLEIVQEVCAMEVITLAHVAGEVGDWDALELQHAVTILALEHVLLKLGV